MFISSVSLRASSIPVKSATIFQSSTAELTRCVTIELKVSERFVCGLTYMFDDGS